jgi:hypothetical protein
MPTLLPDAASLTQDLANQKCSLLTHPRLTLATQADNEQYFKHMLSHAYKKDQKLFRRIFEPEAARNLWVSRNEEYTARKSAECITVCHQLHEKQNEGRILKSYGLQKKRKAKQQRLS